MYLCYNVRRYHTKQIETMNRVSVRLPDDLAKWLNSLDRGEKSKLIVQALRQLKNGSEAPSVAIIKAELNRLNDRLAELESKK